MKIKGKNLKYAIPIASVLIGGLFSVAYGPVMTWVQRLNLISPGNIEKLVEQRVEWEADAKEAVAKGLEKLESKTNEHGDLTWGM